MHFLLIYVFVMLITVIHVFDKLLETSYILLNIEFVAVYLLITDFLIIALDDLSSKLWRRNA